MKLSDSTVLIVDDDIEIIRLISKIITNVGGQVLSSKSVAEALQVMTKTTPHLILTDLMMEPSSGFDLLQKLKSEAKFAQIPRIVISAHSEKNLVYKAISFGACDYLVKPIKAGKVLQKIRKALKDSDFLSFKFPENEELPISCSVQAELQLASDIGFKVQSQVCLNSKNKISLISTNPALSGLERLKFANTHKGASVVKGMYSHDLVAVPADADFKKIIEKIL